MMAWQAVSALLLRRTLHAVAWEAVHRAAPQVVGGCRCQDLLPYLGPGWTIKHHEKVAGSLLASQVLVAYKKSE